MAADATREIPPLPKPPGGLQGFMARHPRLADGFLVAVVVVVLLLIVGAVVFLDVSDADGTPQPRHTGRDVAAVFVLVAVQVAALIAWRRSAPVRFLVVMAATSLLVPAAFAGVSALGTLVAIWALGVYRSVRWAWLGVATGTAVLVVDSLRVSTDFREPDDWVGMGVAVLVMATVAALATNVGNRRRYQQALIDRAVALAAERDRGAELAAAEERARIAREMHDIVAHSLTVIVTMADGAAAATSHDAAAAREAMEQVSETGRAAIEEMRRMLGMLRSDGEAPLAPHSGDLFALVDQFRQLGLPVHLSVEGPEPEEMAVRLALHRIVQESLTNAVRHADRAQRVDVLVRSDGGQIDVEVVDDGRPEAREARRQTGHGLVGMRERVEAYGGTLESGPRPGGGWRVRARLAPHGHDVREGRR